MKYQWEKNNHEWIFCIAEVSYSLASIARGSSDYYPDNFDRALSWLRWKTAEGWIESSSKNSNERLYEDSVKKVAIYAIMMYDEKSKDKNVQL